MLPEKGDGHVARSTASNFGGQVEQPKLSIRRLLHTTAAAAKKMARRAKLCGRASRRREMERHARSISGTRLKRVSAQGAVKSKSSAAPSIVL